MADLEHVLVDLLMPGEPNLHIPSMGVEVQARLSANELVAHVVISGGGRDEDTTLVTGRAKITDTSNNPLSRYEWDWKIDEDEPYRVVEAVKKRLRHG